MRPRPTLALLFAAVGAGACDEPEPIARRAPPAPPPPAPAPAPAPPPARVPFLTEPGPVFMFGVTTTGADGRPTDPPDVAALATGDGLLAAVLPRFGLSHTNWRRDARGAPEFGREQLCGATLRARAPSLASQIERDLQGGELLCSGPEPHGRVDCTVPATPDRPTAVHLIFEHHDGRRVLRGIARRLEWGATAREISSSRVEVGEELARVYVLGCPTQPGARRDGAPRVPVTSAPRR